MVECTALEMRHTGNRIGGSNPSLSAIAGLGLPNSECQEVGGRRFALQSVAGFAHQVRDIDRGQRIGAFERQQVTGRHAGKRLLGAKRRQRAFQAA